MQQMLHSDEFDCPMRNLKIVSRRFAEQSYAGASAEKYCFFNGVGKGRALGLRHIGNALPEALRGHVRGVGSVQKNTALRPLFKPEDAL